LELVFNAILAGKSFAEGFRFDHPESQFEKEYQNIKNALDMVGNLLEP